MKFLLIDFGASYIKTSIYNNISKEFDSYKEYESPFTKCDKIEISEIKNIILNILDQNKEFDFVLSCSIKNGCVVNNQYFSWKLLDQNISYDKESVIGSIFKSQENYHIHSDQDFKSDIRDIRTLGIYNNKVFLSCLGDTECVKRAFDLKDDSVVLNLGTGSQIIYKDNIVSFFPSGRMFLVFKRFFDSLGCNFFEELNKITLNQIIHSTLKIDLSFFPQSKNFVDYGSILNINENNLTKTELLSSILKSYIEQYLVEINFDKINQIILSGGISKKLPVIQDYIKHKYDVEVIRPDYDLPETHLGMAKMIELYY